MTTSSRQRVHQVLQSKQRMKKQKKDQSDDRNDTELKIYKELPGDGANLKLMPFLFDYLSYVGHFKLYVQFQNLKGKAHLTIKGLLF